MSERTIVYPVDGIVRDLILAATEILHHDDDIIEGDSEECAYMRKNLAINFRKVLRKYHIAETKGKP